MQDFINDSLLQDEILVRLASVVDYGYTPGPSFLAALSTLVEAVVLHRKIYFDAFADYPNVKSGDDASTASLLKNSPFIRKLITGEAIHLAPLPDTLDEHLTELGVTYRWIDFIHDAKWQYQSFVPADIAGEEVLYARQATLLREYRGIFAPGPLLDDYSVPGSIVFRNDTAATLAANGVPIENLILIEGYNFLASAYVTLGRHLGLNVYLYDVAFPHQLANVDNGNTRVRELMTEVLSSASELDADIGDSDYRQVTVPALTRAVIEACKDTPGALADELLRLRDKHAPFRKFLTEYDSEWHSAQTLKDRVRLKHDFSNAWEAVTKKYKSRRQRLIYTLWDLLKEPLKILVKIGDKLVDTGKRQSVVGRARGLNEFWEELLDAPLRIDLSKLFRERAPDSLWAAASRYATEAKKLRSVAGEMAVPPPNSA